MSKEYDQALKLAEQIQGSERYSDSIKCLLEIAFEKGDPRAAYALGSWHLHGVGPLANDTNKALEFFEIAASKFHPKALFNIAFAHESGVHYEKSVPKAFTYYLLSSLNGDEEGIQEMYRLLYHKKSDEEVIDTNEIRDALENFLVHKRLP